MDEDNIPIEKRQFSRVFCDASVVLNQAGNLINALSVDVSEDGFRLESDQNFLPGAKYELVFSLDEEARDLKCMATVVWSKTQGDKFVSGFKFSNLSTEDRQKFRHFIQKNRYWEMDYFFVYLAHVWIGSLSQVSSG